MEWLLIPIVAAILGGVLASNKGRSVAGWSILCLLLPICVLIILVLKPVDISALPRSAYSSSRAVGAARRSKEIRVCPQCGERYELLAQECSECHMPLTAPLPKETICPFCKENIKTGALKCRHCGEVFERPAGVPLAEEGAS